MFRTRTTSISLKKEELSEELLGIFDTRELNIPHSEFDIKPLLRTFSKYYTKKIIIDGKGSAVNFKKLVKRNSDWIKSHKVDFSSM